MTHYENNRCSKISVQVIKEDLPWETSQGEEEIGDREGRETRRVSSTSTEYVSRIKGKLKIPALFSFQAQSKVFLWDGGKLPL